MHFFAFGLIGTWQMGQGMNSGIVSSGGQSSSVTSVRYSESVCGPDRRVSWFSVVIAGSCVNVSDSLMSDGCRCDYGCLAIQFIGSENGVLLAD